jgi:uncharacterized membrane protein
MTDRRMTWRVLAKWTFSALFVVAGISHFVSTDLFVKIMPPDLPYHRPLVLLSGAIEIVLGVLFLIPKTSRIAACGLIVLLIAVFPANIYMYQHQELFPLPPPVLLLRLPMQGLLVLWAYMYARK